MLQSGSEVTTIPWQPLIALVASRVQRTVLFSTVQFENLAYVLQKVEEKILPQAKGCLPRTTTTFQSESAYCSVHQNVYVFNFGTTWQKSGTRVVLVGRLWMLKVRPFLYFTT